MGPFKICPMSCVRYLNYTILLQVPCYCIFHLQYFIFNILIYSAECFLEFKELRAENEFFKVCQTPELACEVTMQVYYFFSLVHSILLIYMIWKTYSLVTATCLHAVLSEFSTCV